jgi:hypothetical protein
MIRKLILYIYLYIKYIYYMILYLLYNPLNKEIDNKDEYDDL